MKPIYLHCFDRELTASVGATPNWTRLAQISFTMIAHTTVAPYCSLSALRESCYGNDHLVAIFFRLINEGYINAISHHPSLQDFISSRQRLYSHDIERYPMYAVATTAPEICSQASLIHKQCSTTKHLVSRLSSLSLDPDQLAMQPYFDGSVSTETITEALKRCIGNIGNKAVTWAAFKPHIENDLVESHIKFMISAEYARHYLSFLRGDIITGLPGYQAYDYLSSSFPLLDWQCHEEILNMILPTYFTSQQFRIVFFKQTKLLYGNMNHAEYVSCISNFLLCITTEKNISFYNIPFARKSILIEIRAFNIKPYTDTNPFDILDYWNFAIDHLKNAMSRKYPMTYKRVEENHMSQKVLVCIATDLELEVFMQFVTSKSISCNFVPGVSNTYLSCGTYAGHEIFAVKSQMGSTSAGGATLTVGEAISDLTPHFVISVGIAFGLKSNKHAIGDVLISQQVQMYELQKISDVNIIPRGDRVSASPRLFGRADSSKLLGLPFGIHTGLFLSGEKLVNSPSFKTQLLDLFPEAIGGDMESAGIMSACQRNNIPCITLKGIADWGENKNSDHQALAARNAFTLFFEVLSRTGW